MNAEQIIGTMNGQQVIGLDIAKLSLSRVLGQPIPPGVREVVAFSQM